MDIAIIAFDQFTDIDVFLPWDLLNRVKTDEWKVKILGDKENQVSNTGLVIPTHGHISEARTADAVLVASGPGTRQKIKDQVFLDALQLNPEKQLIGSMCSGALILAALGLLRGKKATTYPTAKELLESYGVEVVEKPFVLEGNIATAAGCLSAQYLAGWIIERFAGVDVRKSVLKSVQPVGEGLYFNDKDEVSRSYTQVAANS